MEPILNAIEFATKAHRGQYRKGSGLPYIVHPIEVMATLFKHKCSQEAIIAGILHDVVEDTSHGIEEIEELFGSRVAELVSSASEPDKTLSWKERKEHTIKFIKECNDYEALMVICADKLNNIKCLKEDFAIEGNAMWDKFNAPKSSQSWYYHELSRELVKKNGRLFDEFWREVSGFFK